MITTFRGNFSNPEQEIFSVSRLFRQIFSFKPENFLKSVRLELSA
jgi:hypothetical protein